MTEIERVGHINSLKDKTCLCGNHPEIYPVSVSYEGGLSFRWEIHCTKCGLSFRYPNIREDSKEAAIEAWYKALHPEAQKEVRPMTSSEFEQAAKKAVKDYLEKKHDVEVDDLQMVWFAHVLGNKKCLLYSKKMENVYSEVTYNVEKNKMYLDMYVEYDHKIISVEE